MATSTVRCGSKRPYSPSEEPSTCTPATKSWVWGFGQHTSDLNGALEIWCCGPCLHPVDGPSKVVFTHASELQKAVKHLEDAHNIVQGRAAKVLKKEHEWEDETMEEASSCTLSSRGGAHTTQTSTVDSDAAMDPSSSTLVVLEALPQDGNWGSSPPMTQWEAEDVPASSMSPQCKRRTLPWVRNLRAVPCKSPDPAYIKSHQIPSKDLAEFIARFDQLIRNGAEAEPDLYRIMEEWASLYDDGMDALREAEEEQEMIEMLKNKEQLELEEIEKEAAEEARAMQMIALFDQEEQEREVYAGQMRMLEEDRVAAEMDELEQREYTYAVEVGFI